MRKFSLLAGTTALLFVGEVAAADKNEWRYSSGDLEITIRGLADTSGGPRSYQVTVANAVGVLTRLEVHRDAAISHAWLSDLDTDGAFEVVVACEPLVGKVSGDIDIHEWQRFRFVTTRAGDLPVALRSGHQGHDRYELTDGHLMRSFPMFSTGSAGSQKTGETVQLVYDYAADRWVTPASRR